MADKNQRICIIGAGVAGLSAAECLKEMGYKNITVLERNDRAGGMALSNKFKTPDNREIVYDLGSVQPTSSKILYRLFDRYDIHIGKKNLSKNANPDKPLLLKVYSLDQRKYIIDFVKYKFGVPLSLALVKDAIKFLKYLFKYRQLKQPGVHLPQKYLNELCIPFDDWIDANFTTITIPLKILGGAITLGNPQWRQGLVTVEAIKFILQAMTFPPTRLRYVNGQLKSIREGFQELWSRVAKEHNVIFNANVSKVIRKQNEIEVEYNNNKLLFDKIIITCSPTQTSQFLDMTSEESELFKKVIYNTGWRVVFTAKNLPHDGWFALYEGILQEGRAFISAFAPEGEIGNGIWLYSSSILVTKEIDLTPYKKEIEKMLSEYFNAEIIEWVQEVYWPEYVPHYSCEDTRNGIYSKLENLQGKKNCYYAGGAISLSSHAVITEYTYDMVKRFFS